MMDALASLTSGAWWLVLLAVSGIVSAIQYILGLNGELARAISGLRAIFNFFR